MSESVSIDGFGPVPVRRPASPAELGELVREAVAAGHGLYPVGGRTLLDLGLPPTKPGSAVDLSGLDQVIDYPARDMTITVQAGVTIAKLQETLAAEHQWLPIDVPEPGRASIGGAVATNTSGPRRLGHGTLRDYVIGISFVTGEGTEVKGGGRVVKNVAGYDLMKLHTGALGTLGVVTRVTLKVKPRPEETATISFGCDTAGLGTVLDLLHGSKARPVLVEVGASPTSFGRPPWFVLVGFEEKRTTVDWQVSTLHAELRSAPVQDITERRGADATKLIGVATEEMGGRFPGGWEPRFSFRASVLPSRTAEFCSTVLPAGWDIRAHGLNGIVAGHLGAEVPFDRAAELVASVSAAAKECGGVATVRRCPPEWKTKLAVWGDPRSDFELMRQVKRTLDPNNVFNPGRLFADL